VNVDEGAAETARPELKANKEQQTAVRREGEKRFMTCLNAVVKQTVPKVNYLDGAQLTTQLN
jgi:hypothetical protein